MLREQAEVIKQQRDLENEIAMLKNQVYYFYILHVCMYVCMYVLYVNI